LGSLLGGEGADVGEPVLSELFHAGVFSDLEIFLVPLDGVVVIAGAFVDAGEVEVGVFEGGIKFDGTAEVLECGLSLISVFEFEGLLVEAFGARGSAFAGGAEEEQQEQEEEREGTHGDEP